MNPNSVPSSSIRYYQTLLKYYWIPGVSVLLTVLTLAVLIADGQRPLYLAQGKLKIAPTQSTATEAGHNASQPQMPPPINKPLLNAAQVIQSQPVLAQTLQTLGWKQPNGQPVTPQDFLQHLEVTPLPAADLLSLKLKNSSPQKAAAGVNALMKTYIERGSRPIDPVQKAFAQKLPKAQQDLRTAELALNEFQRNHPLIALQDQTSASMRNRINALQTELTHKQVQRASTAAQKDAILNTLGLSQTQAAAAPALRQDATIQDLLAQIQQTRAQLVLAQKTLTTDHPTVVQLNDKIENLKTLFGQQSAQVSGFDASSLEPDRLIESLQKDLMADFVRLKTTDQRLDQDIQNLSAQLATHQAQIAELPTLEKQKSALQRQLKVAQTTHDALQQNKDLQLASILEQNNAQVLAKAGVPSQPIWPNKPLYLTIGGILGVILASLTMHGLAVFNQNWRRFHKGRKTIPEAIEDPVMPLLDSSPAFGVGLDLDQPSEQVEAFPSIFFAATDLERSLQSAPPLQVSIDIPALKQIPLDQLQAIIATLQKDWLKSKRLLQAQEEALSTQSQTIRSLQGKLQMVRDDPSHGTNEYDRLSLEMQLVDAEEHERLLAGTLRGQRRKINQRQEILRQHLRVLAKRSQSSMSEATPPVDLSVNS